jgi:dihydropteroate synthase
MPLTIGPQRIDDTDHAVMAIVNRTPDSFYDRGATFSDDAAMQRVHAVVAQGARVVDVGGVKAGPGSDVDEQEEIRRVIPFIEAVRDAYPEVAISVDTWRAAVARRAVPAGADLINDTWSGADPHLVDVAAQTGAALLCSHVGPAKPRTRPHRISYGSRPTDVVDHVVARVVALAEDAVARGVRPDGLVIDPTHDFGKNTLHSLILTRLLDQLTDTGWPVLVSLSNKDFVGETLDRDVEDRLMGTLAATAISRWHGATLFRSHEVAETLDVLDMVAAIKGERLPRRAVRGLR